MDALSAVAELRSLAVDTGGLDSLAYDYWAVFDIRHAAEGFVGSFAWPAGDMTRTAAHASRADAAQALLESATLDLQDAAEVGHPLDEVAGERLRAEIPI